MYNHLITVVPKFLAEITGGKNATSVKAHGGWI
jgi:hypothetical protein